MLINAAIVCNSIKLIQFLTQQCYVFNLRRPNMEHVEQLLLSEVKGLLVLKSAIPLRQLIITCTTNFEKINGTVSSACFKIQAGEGRGVQLEMLIMLQQKRRKWDCTNL